MLEFTLNPLVIIIAGVVLGAVMNRVRGSSIKGGAYMAAAVFCVGVFFVTGSWLTSLLFGAAYILGELIDGWTAWIIGLQESMTQKLFNKKLSTFDDTGRRTGSWWLASQFANPKKDFKKFCIIGMAWRGVVWFAPVFAVLWWFGVSPWWLSIAATLACGILMPYCYIYGSKLSGGEKYLRIAEPIYGAVYGGLIGIALASSVIL